MILAEEIFNKFLQENIGKYDHLSTKELKSACESQFELINQTMESPNLEEVRLQYLFTIRPSKYRVIKQLKNTYKGYSRGNITDKAFNYYSNMMLDYIGKHLSKFTKYEKSISQITGFSFEEIQSKKYKINT